MSVGFWLCLFIMKLYFQKGIFKKCLVLCFLNLRDVWLLETKSRPGIIYCFSLTAQNLKLFGQKLQHFLNNAFQSCYDLIQVLLISTHLVIFI